MSNRTVEPQRIIEQVFGSKIPKESLVAKAHPYTKLLLAVFSPGMALFLSHTQGHY